MEFAKASMTVLRNEASQIIEEFMTGDIRPSRFRSPLYRVPLFRTNFRYWVFAALVIVLLVLRLFL